VIKFRGTPTPEQIWETVHVYGSLEQACEVLTGCKGRATIAAFQQANWDQIRWAGAIAYGDHDRVQAILKGSRIKYESDAVDFIKAQPFRTQLRLLRQLTFRHRGVDEPLSSDYIRDTGYLWSQIGPKPDLGRVRCWFSVHEELAKIFVASLPDGPLPVAPAWERVDGLSSVDGSWEIEVPRRVATLQYYGELLRNCVGAYGPAVEQGRSTIFVVRERGLLTHCVEVTADAACRQFSRSANRAADDNIKRSVLSALQQANLVG
jgi:hypothetical protein